MSKIVRFNDCKNLNHGKSNVVIGFCPQCGTRFNGRRGSCDSAAHARYRKQRFSFCLDCGNSLALSAARP